MLTLDYWKGVCARFLRRAPLFAGLGTLVISMYPTSAAQQLPEDDILSVQLIEIRSNPTDSWHWDAHFEIYYTRNPAHPSVIIGAQLISPPGALVSGFSWWGTAGGPRPAVVEHSRGSVVHGMQRVNIAVRLNTAPVRTDRIEVFMYEPGSGAFLSEIFPFVYEWVFPAG